MSILLQKRQDLQGKGFKLIISALPAMVLESSRQEPVAEVQRLFGSLVQSVCPDIDQILLRKRHGI